MTSINSISSLIAQIRHDLVTVGRAQIASFSEVLTQLLVLDLLHGPITGQQNSSNPDTIIIVVPRAKDFASWLIFSEYLDLCRSGLLPYLAMWGNDRFINPSMIRRQRINALQKISSKGLPTVIVTTLMGLGQLTLSKRSFLESSIKLSVGLEIDQDVLVSKLLDLGYTKALNVEDESTFGVRGGILDVWPPSEDLPVRIEFVGDRIESLRFFAAETQTSCQTLSDVCFGPACESLIPEECRSGDVQKLFNILLEQQIKPSDRDGMIKALQMGIRFPGFDILGPLFRGVSGSAFDFLSPDCTLIFPAGIESALKAYGDFFESALQAHDNDQKQGRVSLGVDQHFLSPESLAKKIDQSRYVEFGNPFSPAKGRFFRFEGNLARNGAPPAHLPASDLFDRWMVIFEDIVEKCNGTVAILAHQEEGLERVRNLLSHRGINTKTEPEILRKLVRGQLAAKSVLLGIGELATHIWLEDRNLLVVPDTALFAGRPRKPKPTSVKLKNYLSSFADLRVSDLVVHIQHGIGRYLGLTSITVAGITSEFLIIEYAGGDKIYLPVDRLSLLQKYSAGSDSPAEHALDRLGVGTWDRRKARVKGAIKDMAAQLLKVQAKRTLSRGYAYGGSDDTFCQFEAMFPYEETDDQLRAIQEVDADLRSGRPMDRLVCGDVGFGKTEVALRAAMRTVLEGFQALVLVPTTVLCYQHYRNFVDRLESFGVRVAQINRFAKPREIKAAVEGVETGTIDILIGTHRLLSKDVKPRRLGLLVIDEEQRFGVGHKEKLKELRADAHVLTLTATPIPRTLHMAMVGLRDISIIATPPQDRLSVRTYITRFDESLIREVIHQEVARGGQVFFVHNRIEDIEEMRLLLSSLLPHLEVRVGHGRMREQDLENVIIEFIEQKFQVLVCTTIIESGIDMPNVNTIIVNRSDQFGLAQLYQLRGRVGRSSTQAYAYFLTPPEDRLSDDARQRLAVLAAHQELGAGFQIASHDLELRGAGNLLGGEQSGHAAAVGLELYTEMLSSAIAELNGTEVEERFDAEIKIPVSARIPETYIGNENQRLACYKNIFAADTEENLRKLQGELRDRYGKLPIELDLLFQIARVKQLLRAVSCIKLTAGKEVCELKFSQLNEKQVESVSLAARKRPEVYRLTPDYRLLLGFDFTQNLSLDQQALKLQQLINILRPLSD